MLQAHLVVGKIVGFFGVAGLVKVYSYTEPREQILSVTQWDLTDPEGNKHSVVVESQRKTGKLLLAKLYTFDSLDEVRPLLNHSITVQRSDLPVLPENTWYIADFLNMRVSNMEKLSLGSISDILLNPVNPVLVLTGTGKRILIPLVMEKVVKEISFEHGTMTVDWQPDW